MKKKAGELPVMKSKCKSCPFQDCNLDSGIANSVTARTLFKSWQICHSTEGLNREANHRCRGSFDVNMEVYRAIWGDDVDKLANADGDVSR